MNYESILTQQQAYTAALPNIDPAKLADFNNHFHVQLSHNSTQISGNSLTLEEAEQLINKGIVAGGKRVQDINELINNHKAAVYTETESAKKIALNEDVLREIHKKICKTIIEGGEYRTEALQDDRTNRQPPVGDAVMTEITAFYANLSRTDLNPIELAAWCRGEMARISPFVTANSRTARLVMNYQLMVNDYPAIIVPVTEKDRYQQLLDQYCADQILEPLADFVAELVEKRMAEYSTLA